jgi:WD40 repeat protein
MAVPPAVPPAAPPSRSGGARIRPGRLFLGQAINARTTAQQERATATYVGLAATAQALLPTRPDLSLLLALEAYTHTPPTASPTLAQNTLMWAREEIWGSGVLGILHGHTDTVTRVAFAPAGSLLASASGDGTIRLWNARTLRQIGQPLRGPPGAVYSVAFSPDGGTLASGHKDAPIYSVAFSPVAQVLAAGGLAGRVYLWDVGSQQPAPLPSTIHSPIYGVAFSHDGHTLASANASDTVQIWDVTHRVQRGQPLTGPKGIVTSVAFGSDDRTLAAGSTDSTIRLWNPAAVSGFGHPLVPRSLSVGAVAFSHAGGWLAWGQDQPGAADTIQLWDVTHGRPMASIPAGRVGVRSLAFSPNGRLLLSATQGGTVQLWHVPSGKRDGPPIYQNGGFHIFSAAFSRHGNRIAFAGSKGTLGLRTLPSGPTRMLDPSPHAASAVYAVAFDSSGSTLASGGDDRNIQLWNAANGTLLRTLTGHTDAVFSLAFSPTAPLLASGSADDTVRLRCQSTANRSGRRALLWASSTLLPSGFSNATSSRPAVA